MSLDLQQRLLRSNVLDYPAQGPLAGEEPMRLRFAPDADLPDLLAPRGERQRTKIWDLGGNLHCSIIGTCLSTAELRQILIRLKVDDAQVATDHELHGLGVMLAGRRDLGAKFLQKALDRRHEATIRRFSAAKDRAALAGLWNEAQKAGDIPGGYWATLTHPLTDEALIKQAFGSVHMLSHLVGAANRADIRRLRQLEEENAALADRLGRAQTQIREGFRERDHAIRKLNALLARHDQAAAAPHEAGSAEADGSGEDADAVRDLSRKLAREAARRERAEGQSAALARALKERERTLDHLAAERDALRRELDQIERRLAVPDADDDTAGDVALDGLTLLYVGGRASQVPQLKAVVENAGAAFLHHDGGIEHNLAQLPGLISRADVVVFPVDCVSHGAVAIVKRSCRQGGPRYVPLRSSGVTSLLSALAGLRRPDAAE